MSRKGMVEGKAYVASIGKERVLQTTLKPETPEDAATSAPTLAQLFNVTTRVWWCPVGRNVQVEGPQGETR